MSGNVADARSAVLVFFLAAGAACLEPLSVRSILSARRLFSIICNPNLIDRRKYRMKRVMVKMARCVLPCACLWACAAGGFTVDGDLPAGNVIVEGIKGDVVKQRQDHGKDVGWAGRRAWAGGIHRRRQDVLLSA